MSEFEPKKKTTDENPIAILLTFLNGQQQLLNNPPPDMLLPEIADTRVLVKALEKFIVEFNAAVYQCRTLEEQIELLKTRAKLTGSAETPKIII